MENSEKPDNVNQPGKSLKTGALIHGGGIFQRAAAAGLEVEEIIDFSANINPLGLPPGVDKVLRESLAHLQHYPEIDGQSLRRAAAAKLGLEPSHLLVGNGSTALIYLLARVLRPRRAVLWSPTFSEYGRALELASCRVENLISWRDGVNLEIADLLGKSLKLRPDIVFICNPGNPTGALWSRTELETVIGELAAAGIVCVIDEAFIDFTGSDNSLVDRVVEFDNLLVLRSLTKIYALAGLRCGYLVGSRELVDHLAPFQEPWSLNYPALRAATAALEKNHDFLKDTVSFIRRERTRLTKEIAGTGYLTPYPAAANYILARLDGGYRGEDLRDHLFREARIMLRLCGDYVGLGNSYVRFAVRTAAENTRLVGALRQFGDNSAVVE